MKNQVEQFMIEEAVGTVPTQQPRSALLLRRSAVTLLVTAVLAASGWAGYWWWSIESGLKRAQQAAKHGEWRLARYHLTEYLDWHPRDSEAHFLMAEAFVKDDVEGSQDFIHSAIHHLQKIEGDAPLAAKARLQEARLVLLMLQQPARAEQLLHASLELEPYSLEANLLMWKIRDLTGRHIISGEYFWRVYELSSEAERPLRLRDWYLAEFYPESANEAFYRALGVSAIGTIPASINLLVRFVETEPEAPFARAALATFYFQQGDLSSSLDILKEAPNLSQAMEDPFFVAALFATLVELGEFEKARMCFKQFPAPRAGDLYLRSEGLFRQYIQEDPAAAVESYKLALATWSGKFDWGLMTRLSECLRKIGQIEESERMQSRVKYLTTKILLKEKTSRLRDKLLDLYNPNVAVEMRDFYQEFGLNQEAAAWEEHRRNLTRASPPSLRSIPLAPLSSPLSPR